MFITKLFSQWYLRLFPDNEIKVKIGDWRFWFNGIYWRVGKYFFLLV
jgi:hypothetical protein